MSVDGFLRPSEMGKSEGWESQRNEEKVRVAGMFTVKRKSAGLKGNGVAETSQVRAKAWGVFSSELRNGVEGGMNGMMMIMWDFLALVLSCLAWSSLTSAVQCDTGQWWWLPGPKQSNRGLVGYNRKAASMKQQIAGQQASSSEQAEQGGVH